MSPTIDGTMKQNYIILLSWSTLVARGAVTEMHHDGYHWGWVHIVVVGCVWQPADGDGGYNYGG